MAGRRCAASLRGGVDISKDTLDACWLSKRKHNQFSNNKTGLRALIRWIRQAEVSLVVFEATGVYHRLLETGLAKQGVPFARVNPRQARRFAEGIGKLAKTDRVDAAMLARMGSLLELEADQPKSETLHDLKQLAPIGECSIRLPDNGRPAKLLSKTELLQGQGCKPQRTRYSRSNSPCA